MHGRALEQDGVPEEYEKEAPDRVFEAAHVFLARLSQTWYPDQGASIRNEWYKIGFE